MQRLNRRDVFKLSAACGIVSFAGVAPAEDAPMQRDATELIIDIHQHLDYSGRNDEQLIAHQRKLGITRTILLPSGRFYGLEAGCGGNDRVQAFAGRLPKEYVVFANEVPYIRETKTELQKYLKAGAKGIGEQKFMVESDSGAVQLIAEIAQDFKVPVLLHFQHGKYNLEFKNFETILKKFPTVNFIGHAQTFWANIDEKCEQPVLYPKGPVTAGGLTDRWLAEYPNLYADLSAGSGLNAFTRDERHGREFIIRHQDKLLFGSDCSDAIGEGDKCLGAQIISMIHRLSPEKAIERKLLYDNANKLFRLDA